MINKLEIIKYKCFDDFILDGLSSINVISGKNNVGKTALLEAFYLTNIVHILNWRVAPIVRYLAHIMKNRGVTAKTFQYSLYSYHYDVKIDDKDTLFSKYKHINSLNLEEKINLKNFNQDYFNFLSIKLNDDIDLIPTDNIKLNKYNYSFSTTYINSSKPTNTELVNIYSQIQTKGLQHKFLKYLQILDKNIVWIEPQLIREEMFLRINLENPEYSLLSSELGEGTNRFIQILAVILTHNNGMVFIDEIENGLHYSRLYNIWKAIIEIVEKEKVQLFVTTHNKESMEALYKASVDSEFNKITSIELYKDESNKIVPIVMDYKNFSLGMEMGEDFR